MFTGLLSFFVFVLSFSFLTNGGMINDQCPINPIFKSPQKYIIRFHDGYTWSQHLDHLSSTVPSLWTSGFAAGHIVNGYTATIPEDVLPHVAADPNVWGISDQGYIYVAGDRNAAHALEKQKQDRLARDAAEEAQRKSEAEPPRWVGRQYIIGLRNTGHIEEHLASLPVLLRNYIEQLIPEINGYAIPTFLSCSRFPTTRLLDTIRKDPNFSDPEVDVTDDGDEKIPLAWVVYFSTAEQKDRHLSTVLKDLPSQHNSSRRYFVVFDSQEQEKKFLDEIYADESVTEVRPQRSEKGMGYDVWDEELQDWVLV